MNRDERGSAGGIVGSFVLVIAVGVVLLAAGYDIFGPMRDAAQWVLDGIRELGGELPEPDHEGKGRP